MKVKLDQDLPIVLFLEKTDTKEKPFATAINPDRSILWTAEMKHDRDGMYFVDGFKMPNTPLLRVFYDVPTAKTISGTEVILKYARSEDVFELDDSKEIIDATQKQINNLDDKLKHRGFVVGTLTKDRKYPGFILGVEK